MIKRCQPLLVLLHRRLHDDKEEEEEFDDDDDGCCIIMPPYINNDLYTQTTMNRRITTDPCNYDKQQRQHQSRRQLHQQRVPKIYVLVPKEYTYNSPLVSIIYYYRKYKDSFRYF
jgi:hypothetical protein